MGKKKNKSKNTAMTVRNSSNIATANNYPEVKGTGFSIDIPEEHFEKLMFMCNEGRKDRSEVSGYGCVQFDGKTFTIGEPYMCKHLGNATETETDPAYHGKLMNKMFQEHLKAKEDGIELHPNKLHWHTHPNMGAFWSATDKNLIRQLGSQGWMIFLVLNEQREIKGAFYQLVEVMGNKHEIFIEDVPVNILYEIDESKHTAWAAEFKECHEKKQVWYPPTTQTYLHGRVYSPSQRSFNAWGDGDTDEVDDYYNNRYGTPMPNVPSKQDSWYLYPEKWDEQGYRYYKGQWQYNPLKDKTLQTDIQRIEELYRNMEDDEINILADQDEEFKLWLTKVEAAGL